MADTLTTQTTVATIPSGTIIATDDAGAAGHVQIVKLALSADGSATTIGADANGLDVDVTGVVPGTGATNLGKAEDAAHASGDVGVMALGVRKDTGAAIAGADGDYTPFQTDATGNVRISVAADETATAYFASLVSGTASVATTSDTQVLAAAGVGVRNYVTSISIANPSSTTVTVSIKDGSTAKWVFIAPAGGGSNHPFAEAPLRGTANTAWNFALSGATTGGSVSVSMSGFTGA